VEGKRFEIDEDNKAIAHTVSKEKIAESGDYNLSGDRYREVISYANVKWPMVELGEIAEIGRGFAFKSSDYVNDGILNFRVTNIGKDGNLDLTDSKYLPDSFISEYKNYQLQEDDFVIVMVGATTGKVGLITKEILPALLNQNMWRFFPDNTRIAKKYLYYLISDLPLLKQGGARDYLKQSDFKQIKIPLPPLEVQEKIVAELNGYQKIIDGAKQVVENYKPAIKIDPDWPMVEFSNTCTLEYGASLPKEKRKQGPFPVVGSNGITGWHDSYLIKGPAIIVGRKGSAGEVVWFDENCFPIDTTYYIAIKDKIRIDFKFLYYILKQMNLTLLKGGGAVPGLNRNDVYQTKQIPLPPLETQQKIVAEIEAERELVGANKKLIEIFEKKIKDKIGEVWGE
jgi:type I restriction enzyme M protein